MDKHVVAKWSVDDTPGVYNPPNEGHYSILPITVSDPDLMRYVIGKDGCVFKAITERLRGCRYIWYHADREHIEFWTTSNQWAIRVREVLNERMNLIESNKHLNISDPLDMV